MILKVERLSKSYGAAPVLKDVSLRIERPGVIVGILGPNGAGKTTLVEIIEGLRTPTSGTVTVLGLDPLQDNVRLRERIGVQLQSTVLPPELTPLETLRLFGAFYSHTRPASELLEQVGLCASARARNGRLSIGQQRRLAVALALVNDPELVILDEPTSGLDPVARREIHNDLLGLRAAGRTILLTSHDLEEVERLCDRVILLRTGEIVADGNPAQLAASKGATPRLLVAVEGGFDAEILLEVGAIAQGTEGVYSRFATPDPAAAIRVLGEHLQRERRTLIGLELKHPSLEQFYLEAMGPEPYLESRGRP